MASKTIDSASKDWKLATKRLVVYGNTAGTGSPVLPGLALENVDVAFAGGTYKAPDIGVPETVTITIVNYKHKPIFDLGKLTKIKGLSLNVNVKPSITMHCLPNAASI